MTKRGARLRPLLWLATVLAGLAQSQPPSDVAAALRSGGYVIVMRHANSPRTPPTASEADPDNTALERQLDAPGKLAAREMGEAFRRLRIPLGNVYASPTYRALETVKYAQFGPAVTVAELGDGGQGMAADTTGSRSAWLKTKSAELPQPGRNTLIITHLPNITEAMPAEAAGLSDGEALILQPDGHGHSRFITRVKIADWSRTNAGK
jgi:phosphohistidine phosphatase SixA